MYRDVAQFILDLVVHATWCEFFIFVLLACRRRRAMGLERRSPRWGVVYLLSQLNSSWTKHVAAYIARHQWQFYIGVVAGIWGIIKGNQKLQHWLVSLRAMVLSND